jgi:hypothetical protein
MYYVRATNKASREGAGYRSKQARRTEEESAWLADLADARGRAGDEDDLAAEVLAPGEGADEEAVEEAAHQGHGEVDGEHQRQPHVHEAPQERVHHCLLAHIFLP